MRAALLAEYRTLVSTRLWWILLLGMGVYLAFIGAVMAFFLPHATGEDAETPPLAVATPRTATYSLVNAIGYVFPLVVGSLSVTTEFRHRTITQTLLVEPRPQASRLREAARDRAGRPGARAGLRMLALVATTGAPCWPGAATGPILAAESRGHRGAGPRRGDHRAVGGHRGRVRHAADQPGGRGRLAHPRLHAAGGADRPHRPRRRRRPGGASAYLPGRRPTPSSAPACSGRSRGSTCCRAGAARWCCWRTPRPSRWPDGSRPSAGTSDERGGAPGRRRRRRVRAAGLVGGRPGDTRAAATGRTTRGRRGRGRPTDHAGEPQRPRPHPPARGARRRGRRSPARRVVAAGEPPPGRDRGAGAAGPPASRRRCDPAGRAGAASGGKGPHDLRRRHPRGGRAESPKGRGSPPRTATRSRAPRSPTNCSISPPRRSAGRRWRTTSPPTWTRVVAFEDHVPEDSGAGCSACCRCP